MKKILIGIKNYWPILGLFLTSFILIWANFTPGTFLSGWDTLHPEFNFGLNFERIISGVFREEQGLGAVAAHAHMADLPRMLILYFESFFIPQSFIRYSYIFLNLIIGPIGMYFFLQKIVIKNKLGSFLGSSFYILNLGTMQQFIVPFEMFITQYGILPWIFLSATNYFYKPTLRNAFFFSIVTFFTAPMAYASTLWYVYFACLAFYLLSLSILEVFRKNFYVLKSVFILLFLTLLVNSFWILPNLYFFKTTAKFVPQAKINKLFSPQAFLYNKEFGNIKDISLIKTFLFDWNVYADNKKFEYLLNPWIKHLERPNIEKIGLAFPIMAILGIAYAFKKKNKTAISFIPIFFISLFFLINDNPPTQTIYRYLQNNFPLLNEALRFPHNKILGIFIFLLAVYIGISQVFIENIIKKTFKKSYLKICYVQVAIVLVLLIIYMFPAFSGNLISPYMRIKIPKEYFALFEWFNEQPSIGRIANLPIHSFWGWEYYDWHKDNSPSFQGAGFLWFGIKQPLLSRDFDRWNPANEQYYREMSQAIYSQDQNKLNNVLQKYDISYILLDKSIIAPEQEKDKKVLFQNETENLLNNDLSLQKISHFGDLLVYQTGFENSQVRVIKNPVSVDPSVIFYDDFAYAKYHDYIAYSKPEENTVLYPFRNIIDNQNRITSKDILASFSKSHTLDPKLILNTNNECPPINTREKANFQKKIVGKKSDRFIEYVSSGGSFCEHFSYSSLPRSQAYLISITARNLKGLPIRLCITNYISKRCDLFTHLSSSPNFKEDLFLLPPIDQGLGFDININNFSFEGSPSINDLKSIKIIPFSYTEISQIEQYRPINKSNDANFIVFSQSFDSGWKAYEMRNEKSEMKNWLKQNLPFFFGKELKEHVLVNNWANGWILDDQRPTTKDQRLIIIFWPQYLEYLGFGILIGTFLWLVYLNFRGINQRSEKRSQNMS